MIEGFLIAAIVVAVLTAISPCVMLINDQRIKPNEAVGLIAEVCLFAGGAICIGSTVVLSIVLLVI